MKYMLIYVSQFCFTLFIGFNIPVDPTFISLTTIQVGKKIKDIKDRVFGLRVTDITSGGHKQKGPNLLLY
jgi:hypothetical protein